LRRLRIESQSASPTSEVCIKCDGTGNYAQGRIEDCRINNGKIGVYFTGSGVNAVNATMMNGCTISGTSAGAGFVIEASSNGNTMEACDLENWGSAMSWAYGGNTAWGLRLESNWTNALLSSAVNGCLIQASASGSTHSTSDLGTNNQLLIGHAGSTNYLGRWRTTQLSVRTAASLDSTNLLANEVAFQVNASGASLALRSGGTVWYFGSSLSTKG